MSADELRDALRADLVANRSSLKSRVLVTLYRRGQILAVGGGLLARLYRLGYWALTEFVLGYSLPLASVAGPGLIIRHGTGMVISNRARLGAGCTLHHNVTIGARRHAQSVPVIGDRVAIGTGATLVGAITIGDDVVIGPHALVICDVPSGSVVHAPVAVVKPAGVTP